MPNIDDHIKKAQQDGQFEDLPGKGKPLNIDDDPFADPEWRLAHHMIKSSGFTLPWIEKRQEILNQLEASRSALANSWRRRQQLLKENKAMQPVEAEWKRAVDAFSGEILKLNKAIQDYNLEAPSAKFQLPPLSTEREVARITKEGGE